MATYHDKLDYWSQKDPYAPLDSFRRSHLNSPKKRWKSGS